MILALSKRKKGENVAGVPRKVSVAKGFAFWCHFPYCVSWMSCDIKSGFCSLGGICPVPRVERLLSDSWNR